MSAPASDLGPLPLAAEFPAATRDEWRALVSAVLARSGAAAADADPEQALASVSYDGIRLAPLYTADDAPASPAGAAAPRWAGWDVRQRHADPDAARGNAAVLADLSSGATSLWLVLGDGGLPVAELPRALDGVYLDLAPIALDAGAQTAVAAEALLALARERGVAAGELRGSLGADPIGLRARSGAPAALGELRSLVEVAAPTGLRIATVDATVYHDAGGSDADEIALSAAVGVAYLRVLVEGGQSVDDALRRIEFRYAVTADQFASIAKLRAARRIWARVAELSGSAQPQFQHATTSAVMLTRRDPWVNLLRGTLACFAAAVGGADAITVLPFDTALGLPDDFARRIARNTQSVLHDEASLGRVLDPAAGAWYVESYTEQLAQTAWATFTAIERGGGALAALDDGTVARLVGTARDARTADIAHRRAPLTGVTEFAFLGEAAVTRAAAPPAPSGGPLPAQRWAEPFEVLRDRADVAAQRPQLPVACLGPPSAHSARAGFVANLLAAGGIEAVTLTGDAAQLAEAFAATGAPIVCLCSNDKVYAEQAESVAAALRAAGARRVLLAGRGEFDGVDGSLFAGMDAVAVLTDLLDELGVPA
jgi:methylmalonyl-CoA mutase